MVPSVKFATSQYFNGGMHPIGYIGVETTISETSFASALFDDPSNDHSLYYIAE